MGVGPYSTLSFVQGKEKPHPGAFGRWMCTGQLCLTGNHCTGFESRAQQLPLCGGFIIEGLNS